MTSVQTSREPLPASFHPHNRAPLKHFSYPLATAPDIIRSHQKDAYFAAVLSEQVSSTLRQLFGARFAHVWSSEARTAAELLYFGLTTVVGNRTLGEEYCDIVQVEQENGKLPSIKRRGGYVLASVLAPYLTSRLMPRLNVLLKKILSLGLTEENGQVNEKKRSKQKSSTLSLILLLRKVQRYLLKNVDTITSTSPVYAVSLALFYFSGAYYHIGKRIFGLRYLFSRSVDPESASREGYEVLGVLLVLQLAAQAWFHVKDTFAGSVSSESRQQQLYAADIHTRTQNVSLDPNQYSDNNALLPDFSLESSGATSEAAKSIEKLTRTHFPPEEQPNVDLGEKGTMGWISSRQSRKCMFCLDLMKEPSVATCGHVFCWSCISDWCKEKSECPLCRQTCLIQHVLLLRG